MLQAVYGTLAEGATGERRFDEKGYLALPPCVWGSPQDGLQAPPFLSWDTNLTSIKRANATYAHTGGASLPLSGQRTSGQAARPSLSPGHPTMLTWSRGRGAVRRGVGGGVLAGSPS